MASYDIKGHEVIVDDEDKDLLDINWSINNGYVVRSAKPKQMHRIILERKIERDLIKGEVCDHADGNPLNNSRANLRVATQAQNVWNRKVHPANTTGYKGVYIAKLGETWDAVIRVRGELIKLGRFTDIREAIKAYNDAAIEHYGEFARLNPIPQEDPYKDLKALDEDLLKTLKDMSHGRGQTFPSNSSRIDRVDVLVEMGLATRHVETRIEHYVHYEPTEAARSLLYPEKSDK